MPLFQWMLASICLLTASAFAADTTAWKSRNIYFALTDRISRGSSDDDAEACSNLGNYCGGTFKGLESKLDYIRGMGFDAIWITPVVANKPGGYHGYWAQDLYSINENYGTADDLKDLVDAAHDKDMFVMVDVVANHMGKGPIAENKPSPLDQEASYHPSCDIQDGDYENNQTAVEECRLAGLPDLFTQKEEIRELFQDWIKWLVTEYSFDGIRIDTVKHVEKDFWPGFVGAAGVYAVGEVLNGAPSYLADYADLMPGLLNYAMYYALQDFYQQKSPASRIVDMHDWISRDFADPAAMGTFIDNHDQMRWLAKRNDQAVLKNVLAYVILARGIPIVYYGTEQGYSGGNDPNNREDLWRSDFNVDTDLYRAIANLSQARNDAGGPTEDDHVHLYATENAYAWSRVGGNLIVLTTNTGQGTNDQHCFNTQLPNGQWSDVLGNGAYSADANGNICLQVTNGEPVVLLAVSSSTPVPTTTSPTNPTETACPSTVAVAFSVRVTTDFGDTIKVVGSNDNLGNWKPENGFTLSASTYTPDNPVWTATATMPVDSTMAFKFVNVKKDGTTVWESDPNRNIDVRRCAGDVKVDAIWQSTGHLRRAIGEL